MSGEQATSGGGWHHITGRTRLLGILADPIAHVKAPPRINQIARDRGRDAVMVPFQVAPADLPDLVATLRRVKSFDGAIVTVPHKTAMADLCDTVSAEARAVGAVNIIRREDDGSLTGDVLDGRGFVAGLAASGIALRGKALYLAGAGGAASAIAFAVAAAGIRSITLANRSREKAQELGRRLSLLHPGLPVAFGGADPAGHEIVVNGTSLGMRPDDPLPLDAGGLSAGTVVAEVVMEPALTPLLAQARQRGCTIHYGKPMLDHQLTLMADFMKL